MLVQYVETGSMQESFDVQAEICETYRLDFAKYSPKADKYALNAVLTSIAQKCRAADKVRKACRWVF